MRWKEFPFVISVTFKMFLNIFKECSYFCKSLTIVGRHSSWKKFCFLSGLTGQCCRWTLHSLVAKRDSAHKIYRQRVTASKF
jgi:hypothetical protein